MGRARELANLFSGGSADINVKTSDGGILNLQTSDTTVTQDSVVGSIQFQAPDEASGTDAILVASKIEAIAEGTFSASSNATSLVFSTASSAAAGTVAGKMTFTSGGELVIKDTDTADGSSPTITLQSGDTDIAQDDVLGSINFQAPDEGTGTDAILVAAGIAAVSEGDFSSSSNATKLSFKTGSSEAASEKMSLSSAGILTVSDDIVIKSGGTIGGANDTDLLTLGNAALTVAGTIGGTAITASGRLITDDTTEATSTTDGSLQTDGGLSVAKDVVIGDDLKLLSDDSVIHFGADSDVTITHDPDDGLIFKSVATGDDNPFLLTLQTGETDMAANDVMGKIQFQAPDEGTGTDAILVGAAIQAVAEGDFSSSNNETRLEFMTANSEAATTKMVVDGDGGVGIGTTDPDDALHVVGTAQIETTAGTAAFLRIDNTPNTNGDVWRVGAGVYAHDIFSIYSQTDNAFPFNVRNYNGASEIKVATEITLADDAELFVAANCQGLFIFTAYSEGLTGIFRTEYQNIAQVISANSTFSNSDTDGKYCVIVGTNSYSIKIKNRMGGSRSVRCMFLGTHT